MLLNQELLEKLACPNCGNPLRYDEDANRLLCTVSDCSFSIVGEVPILLPSSKQDSAGFDYLEHYETDAKEFDYFETRLGATEHSERRVREEILLQMPPDVRSVLDVGSGSAWVAKHFQNEEVFVCSLDATIINTAKALEKYPSSKHAAVVADAFALPFRKGTFDCVIASEIIEHVPDPKAFVRSLLKVLKPGGVLIISTPYKEVLKYSLCIHCNQKTPLNAHLHSFDEEKLRALYDPNDISKFEWLTLNNKLVIFARMHVILMYLPFKLWKFADSIANLFYLKPLNIVIKAIKGNNSDREGV
ncbi:MAG: methyltransferase domain-containing protein [Ignavibacteriota bacterium]